MFQFTLTGPAVTTALLLTLVNIAIVTPEERETAFRYLGPGYTCIDIGWSSKQLSYSTQSVTECAFKALNREATFFTYNKRSQFCSTYLEGVKVELTNEQDSNEMSFYKADTWRKAYRVDMQSRVDIYKFFLKIGPHSAWNTDRYAYRNKLIDSWNYLPIDKVKFEALKFGAKAITLLFDGRNSTIDNWFQYARLISSPWTDLNATNFNMFSVHGNKVDRSFSIGYFGDTCEEDRGWLTVIDRQFNCSYANLTYYPAILYTNSNSQTVWSEGYGLIDFLNIYIHLK